MSLEVFVAVPFCQKSDSYIDRYNEERKVAYAVVEADLTDQTKASLGASYQQIDLTGVARGGLPSFYTDGTLINGPVQIQRQQVGRVQTAQRHLTLLILNINLMTVGN